MKVTIKNADQKTKELEKAEYHIREAKKRYFYGQLGTLSWK